MQCIWSTNPKFLNTVCIYYWLQVCWSFTCPRYSKSCTAVKNIIKCFTCALVCLSTHQNKSTSYKYNKTVLKCHALKYSLKLNLTFAKVHFLRVLRWKCFSLGIPKYSIHTILSASTQYIYIFYIYFKNLK